MAKQTVRIGGASGFWGDASMSTPQLLADGKVDYIVYDYLAEITMSIMGRARAADPAKGYAADFVSAVLAPNLREIARQGVKIISNAGGVNVAACGAAVRAAVEAQGLSLKVAVVEGDDLYGRREQLAGAGYKEMFSGSDFPAESLVSMNAYLGGFPIARALAEGADIVVTGRCVDSAVTLGACIHEFGWTPDDHDKLAGGSLAGHIIECGPQATGGNFTDWRLVADTIHDIGYPIAEMAADGTFVCTKPEGTGGLVNVGTVAEQLVYEIGDPQAYFLPELVCDFSQATIAAVGQTRVHVSGATGAAAPDTYKVSATYADGFRTGMLSTFYGVDAGEKAAAHSEAILRRARMALRGRNLPDFTETSIELLGGGSHYGDPQMLKSAREVVAKVAVRHPDQAAANIFLREATGLGLAAPPSLSGFTGGGRASVQPVVRLFSFLIPRREAQITVEVDGRKVAFQDIPGERFDPAAIARPAVPAPPAQIDNPVRVPLTALAWGRSGDKGDKGNIGLVARDPEFYPWIRRAMTPEVVAQRFAHFLQGGVERFDLPGICAVNFLLHEALGGGGIASLRNDPQAKGFAALLLDHEVEIPAALAAKHGLG
ncbi:MAG: acyclic terpene utilization AtuA family protein [Phenylobacterium sp.]